MSNLTSIPTDFSNSALYVLFSFDFILAKALYNKYINYRTNTITILNVKQGLLDLICF